MLTLTRKPDESIIIGDGEDQIEVTVKEIRRNQVRLGITAPNHIKIFRKELLDRETKHVPATSPTCDARRTSIRNRLGPYRRLRLHSRHTHSHALCSHDIDMGLPAARSAFSEPSRKASKACIRALSIDVVE